MTTDHNQSLTVLESFPQPRPTTNPYLIMLADALRAEPGVVVQNFGWRAAMLGRFDVFHVHWPEILATGRTPLRKLARQGLLLLFLARLAVLRIPVVRTIHNLERPEGIGWRERRLLDLVDRATTGWVRLNDHTPAPEGALVATVPHGHYRDWFAQYPRSERANGRFGYFGLIRRYKGVEGLVSAFRSVPRASGSSLRLGGKPSTGELALAIEELAGDDNRIALDLHFLTDAQLVEIASESELVVLPYRFMHNSGGVLSALSLDRPVLVPDNPVNRDLALEVGAGWVNLFAGELTPRHLVDGLASVRTPGRSASPDLDGRGWAAAGAAHAAIFRAAIARRHAR